MTKPINPVLQQIVANIASNAKVGRTQLSWGVLAEARKKKNVKESNMAPKKEKKAQPDLEPAAEQPADDVAPAGTEAPKGEPDAGAKQGDFGGGSGGGLPPLDAAAPAGGEGPDAEAGPDAGADEAPAEENPEDAQADVAAAQADVAATKAELEKAKAEKDQAEQDIKKHSYVNLISSAGVHFLLGKLVDHAFKTNTIDSLASEMTGKLKIQTPDDFANFSEEMSPYRGIPGIAELLASMKDMAGKQPDTEEEPSNS
jgi:hypothetical protein